MSTTASIWIERNGVEGEIEVTGEVERCGGRYRADVDDHDTIDLTRAERDRAEQALIDAWGDDDSDDCAAEMRWEARRDWR